MSKKKVIDVDRLKYLIEDLKLQQWRVADMMGLSRKKMPKFCKRYGIKTQRTGPRSGPGHPEWKGGRVVDKDGYVLVYSPDHPFATGGRKIYVREHRLVMEKHLGRPLLREEVVHHANGDKQDNRIENLKLFSENSEHLREELTGKCPNWTEAGKARILAAVRKQAHICNQKKLNDLQTQQRNDQNLDRYDIADQQA